MLCMPGPKIIDITFTYFNFLSKILETYECKIIVQYVAEQKAECSTGELVMETLDCFMVLVVRGMKQHWKIMFYKLGEILETWKCIFNNHGSILCEFVRMNVSEPDCISYFASGTRVTWIIHIACFCFFWGGGKII